jgi:hypothetical protein
MVVDKYKKIRRKRKRKDYENDEGYKSNEEYENDEGCEGIYALDKRADVYGNVNYGTHLPLMQQIDN